MVDVHVGGGGPERRGDVRNRTDRGTLPRRVRALPTMRWSPRTNLTLCDQAGANGTTVCRVSPAVRATSGPFVTAKVSSWRTSTDKRSGGRHLAGSSPSQVTIPPDLVWHARGRLVEACIGSSAPSSRQPSSCARFEQVRRWGTTSPTRDSAYIGGCPWPRPRQGSP